MSTSCRPCADSRIARGDADPHRSVTAMRATHDAFAHRARRTRSQDPFDGWTVAREPATRGLVTVALAHAGRAGGQPALCGRSRDREPTARGLAAIVVAIFVWHAQAPVAGAAAAWLRPVPGDVVRPFDYAAARPFASGLHRGADLASQPGAMVRAACAGHVLHAGAVAAHGGVVTVACGARRVTYLPLKAIAVRTGSPVARGAAIGTVAAGHNGLHVGVRRARDRFGYEDPMARIGEGVGPAPGLFSRPPVPARPRAPGARPRTASPGASSESRGSGHQPARDGPPSTGIASRVAGQQSSPG